MALLGVQDLAIALGVAKGTVSKRADAGSIPVAGRNARGHPLFDLHAVRDAWDNNVNPLMRRPGVNIDQPADAAEVVEKAAAAVVAGERRSPDVAPRQPSGLLQQQIQEKQLRIRHLAFQLGSNEKMFVLQAVVDNDVTTMARQTRDGVAAEMVDFAGELYAFASRPHTEGEYRIWLADHTGRAFDEVDKALAAEKGDEFGDGTAAAAQQPQQSDASAAP